MISNSFPSLSWLILFMEAPLGGVIMLKHWFFVLFVAWGILVADMIQEPEVLPATVELRDQANSANTPDS